MQGQGDWLVGKIIERYEVGDRDNIQIEDLLRMMEDMYQRLAVAVNRKPDIITRENPDGDGQTNETFLSNGDININLTTNKVEMLTNHPSTTTVTWTQLS